MDKSVEPLLISHKHETALSFHQINNIMSKDRLTFCMFVCVCVCVKVQKAKNSKTKG